MQEEINISEGKGWLARTKDIAYENWQTILVALIVLIVGISAYNHNQQSPSENSSIVEENTEEETVDINKEEETEKQDEQEANAQDQETKKENNEAQIANESSEPQKEEAKDEQAQEEVAIDKDGKYEITAIRGEGITHMARRAMEQYLKENSDDEITELHKIYIEDYIQNRTGSQNIEIGHKESFSKTTIAEAIASSKKLSTKSLNNLKKYTTQ